MTKTSELTDFLYMRIAYRQALHSPDLSTQNGAIVLNADGGFVGGGCNTFPDGVKLMAERLQRPEKYLYTEHAERNAIFEAGRSAESLVGGTMYALWAACADCARAIIQSGITELVTHSFYLGDVVPTPGRLNWAESIGPAFVMLEEAGVNVRFVDFEVMDSEPHSISEYRWPLRFNGVQVRY